MEEMSFAMRHAEEKAKSSALDAIRLAEELRSLQERSEREETEKRSLENLIKELQIRLEESELNTNRLAKKAIEKLETQVLNLHSELDQEQTFKSDLSKNLRKAERRFRECEFQLEEERKSAARLQVSSKNFVVQNAFLHLSSCLKPRFCICYNTWCLKITEKLSLNIASEVSYVYNLNYRKVSIYSPGYNKNSEL